MAGTNERTIAGPPDGSALAVLAQIQQRVLWLATRMIHEANHVRPNPDGSKVGGHQASSASLVTIMTALYFHYLQAADRVAVKPHASPVLHAIHYLLGQLSRDYLTTLRAYQGLQAYPSRSKDPDPVDFSTGSVGLGAVAPAFAALAYQYARDHFGGERERRFVALVGDAELDEGNVWEALLDQALNGVGNILWIVDLNRQSLDRVIPGIRQTQLAHLFEGCGWRVLEAKYGRRLEASFARPGGAALRRRIDDMPNEEYQALIRLPGAALRSRLANSAPVVAVLDGFHDDDLPGLLQNLGGHDLETLLELLAEVDQRPTVLFAYTIKGWGLPMAGHPLNHSMLLDPAEIDALREQAGLTPEGEWDGFAPDSPAGQLCAAAAARLFPARPTPARRLPAAIVPADLDLPDSGEQNTQQSFGRALVALSREQRLAERLVTLSPDVAASTNLAGWVTKAGVYAPQPRIDFEAQAELGRSWQYGPQGRHIELGISEMNLFMALGAFGLSAELFGEHLIPIGTVYDPFVLRGLDAFIYGLYGGARFIIAGTPSGITLSPEGGAHQSTITSSVGSELPNLHFYEPAYTRELAWMLLAALADCCDVADGRATYLRLSTRPVDQAPFHAALARLGADRLRAQVLAGGYRLRDWQAQPDRGQPEYLVHLAATGAMLPEALAAADMLAGEGIPANVLNLTSPRRLYETWQATSWGRSARSAAHDPLAWLIPPRERRAPIVTVNDGASHALAWLGSVFGTLAVPLGVDQFGQSGARADLYRHYGIDAPAIADAALAALNRQGLA